MSAALVAQPDTEPGIDLYPRQFRYVRDESRWLLAVGGIGSGKSTVAMAKVVSRVISPGLGMITAPTFPMLRDATLRSLFALLDQAGIEYRLNKGEHLITIARSGHEILYRSADDPDNLRGPNLDYVAIDEVGYLSEAAFRVIRGRVRHGGQVWAAGTPKGRNWVWEWWVRDATLADGSADSDRALYRFATAENPSISPDFAPGLGYTGEYAAQELLGEFVAYEGIVYPTFQRETMVRRHTDLDGWSCTLGVDVGVRNPTAVIRRRTAGDGRTHIEREFYVRNLSSTDIIDAVIAEYQAAVADGCKPDAVWVDPSAAGYIADLTRRHVPAKKADNDRRRGVQLCQSDIDAGLTVDPSCINFLAEIESYHYPDSDGTKDDPVKEHDHCFVAGTLVTTARGEVPIEQVTSADDVMTRDGWRRVRVAGQTGFATALVRLTTTRGDLVGTPSHPVFDADHGWTPMGEVQSGGRLVTCQATQRSSCIEASPFVDTPTPIAGVTGPISHPAPRIGRQAWAACIKRFGETRTGRYRRAFRFITETATPITMPSIIWNAFPLLTTGPGTKGNRQAIGSALTLKRSGHLPGPGMQVLRAVNGIEGMVVRYGKAVSRAVVLPVLAPAITVALSTSRISIKARTARTHASRQLVAPLVSITKTGRVSFVDRRSEPTDMPRLASAVVLAVQPFEAPEPEPVYNLTVDDRPEFVANGLLVHNCMDSWRYACAGDAQPKRRLWIA